LSIGLLPPFLKLDSLKVVALFLCSCQLFPVTLGQSLILSRENILTKDATSIFSGGDQ